MTAVFNMVKCCSVYGCKNRANAQAREKGVKFFRFPVNKHKRRTWVKALNRENWTPTAYSYVCSAHFVAGWHSDERGDVDYAPTIFAYKQKKAGPDSMERFERAFRRDLAKVKSELVNC